MGKVASIQLESGVELEYEEWGSGERAFVLVHGFTGSRDDWLEHLPALGAEGRTIAIDQRGHGGSSNTAADYTLDQLVEDLHGALDVLGISRCDLLGHSLGGMIALRFAVAHPDRISSLILMDTAARGVSLMPAEAAEASANFVAKAGTLALARVMREGARKNGSATLAAKRTIDLMGFDRWWDRIEAKLAKMDPVAFVSLLPQLANQEPLGDRLAEIDCPTTVIVGEEDLPFLTPSTELAAAIPNAIQVTIPQAAHSPQLENPEAWRDAILLHLERVRGSRD